MGNIRLILARKLELKETLGTYIVMEDNRELFRCCCIELPWLNNQHDISCIIGGTYWVEKFSNKKHPNCFWIKDVPGRSGILIHKGTFATGSKIDTLGCQMPGLGLVDVDNNGFLDVTGSGIAMDCLNYYLPNKFQIIIV
jgi:hypothetical protein